MLYEFDKAALFGETDLSEIYNTNGNLILYGAGKVAEIVDFVLKKGAIDYICYCDTYKAGQTKNGKLVMSLEELEEKYPDVPVLITTIHHRSVADSLKNTSHKIYSAVPLLLRVDLTGFDSYMSDGWASRMIDGYLTTMLYDLKEIFCLSDFIVAVSNICNLSCRDCSALTPYYEKPYHFDLQKTITGI
jgi:hypothetical protein